MKIMLGLGILIVSLNVVALNIHVIGDSHAFFCFTNTYASGPSDEHSIFYGSKNGMQYSLSFLIHPLVSRTLHRVGRDGIRGLNIRNFGVQDGDIVVFLFGEVDVRCHIGRQRDECGRSQQEIIETLVTNYFKTIQENVSGYRDLICIVASLVPPCDQGFNPVQPFYGLLSDRVTITQQLNGLLKGSATMYGMHYLDIYALYAQEDGSFNLTLSDGIVHVSPRHNRLIKEALADIIYGLL